MNDVDALGAHHLPQLAGSQQRPEIRRNVMASDGALRQLVPNSVDRCGEAEDALALYFRDNGYTHQGCSSIPGAGDTVTYLVRRQCKHFRYIP
jgi:hypothetical protein